MRKVRELMAKAMKDFELAKKHKQTKEYVTATTLYTNAVEKVLKALFISKTKRDPPRNATIHYLARRTGVPTEVSMYMASIEESSAMEDPADFLGIDDEIAGSPTGKNAETEAFYMEGLVKRLLDYVYAYAKP